jgi:hypothetical protein
MKLEHEAELGEPRTVNRPWISTSPAVGRSSRPSKYKSEDLPEPDGPVIATNSFSRMRRLMPCTSVVGTMPGRMRVTLRASISAFAACAVCTLCVAVAVMWRPG